MVHLSLPEHKISIVLAAIRKKKELQGINLNLVREGLESYLTKNPSALSFILQNNNPRAARYKIIIKKVRAELRKKSGLFQTKAKINREEMVTLILSSPSINKEALFSILATHASTRERIPFYKQLYPLLFQHTGKPKTILDLGCGLNPFSIPFMKLKQLHYYAYDINDEEIQHLNSFFAFLKKRNTLFEGKAEILNVLNAETISSLPRADISFLFKMTDLLDQGKGHKKTEEVIKAIPANHIIISFPTVTMSGKRMNVPRRQWMEWLCQRLGYKYTILEFPTEIFYVVGKMVLN